MLLVNFVLLSGFSQDNYISDGVLQKIIDNDSTYFESDYYSDIVFCINCNFRISNYKNHIVKSFNEKECIEELKKDRNREFLAIRIDSIVILNKEVKLDYSIGLVKHSYYNKKMKLLAALDYEERHLTLPLCLDN